MSASRRYDDKGWRATFCTTGMEHSPTSATGTAWERTPWRATQRAAWDALRRADEVQGCWSSRARLTTNGAKRLHAAARAWRSEPKREITEVVRAPHDHAMKESDDDDHLD
jgi:hypothetical protein